MKKIVLPKKSKPDSVFNFFAASDVELKYLYDILIKMPPKKIGKNMPMHFSMLCRLAQLLKIHL